MLSREDLEVIEAAAMDDCFVTTIGKTETLGALLRVYLCAPENSGNHPILLVKDRLLIPRNCLVPMARGLIAAAPPFGNMLDS